MAAMRFEQVQSIHFSEKNTFTVTCCFNLHSKL